MAEAWLGIDHGQRRIGLAVAEGGVKVARPLVTLTSDANIMDQLKELIDRHHITTLVVGRPRGLDGGDTAQTAMASAFAASLESFGLPVHLVDEAGTSALAAQAVDRSAAKGAVDAAAAAIILQDYLDGL